MANYVTRSTNQVATNLSPINIAETEEGLRKRILDQTGLRIAAEVVCPEHVSVWDSIRSVLIERPPLTPVLRSRGAGRSFLSALNTYPTSLKYPRRGTRILGGSRAQSEQVYRAVREIVLDGKGRCAQEMDPTELVGLTKTEALY
jgi:hypothetical protein